MSLSSQNFIQEWEQKEKEIAPLFVLIFLVLKLHSHKSEMYSQNHGEKVRNFARWRITVGENEHSKIKKCAKSISA